MKECAEYAVWRLWVWRSDQYTVLYMCMIFYVDDDVRLEGVVEVCTRCGGFTEQESCLYTGWTFSSVIT